MNSHYDLNDREFEKQFANATLDPSMFNHEAHLRLAWVLINNVGLQEAEKKIQEQLQHYVMYVGAQDKYNKTLTIVAMRMVNHFMQASKTTSFKKFITENSQLKTGFKELIDRHYRFDIFNSYKAKTEFLAPDVQDF